MAGVTYRVENDGRECKGLERRAWPRYPVPSVQGYKGGRSVDGIEARLINISRRGILFETTERLIPDGTAYIRLIAADAMFMLRGRILRSGPSQPRNSNTNFESAVEFDGKFPMSVRAGCGLGAEVQEILPCSGIGSGSEQVCAPPSDENVPQPIYMIRAIVPRIGPDLSQIFNLNNC